jgi:hypothetical protein
MIFEHKNKTYNISKQTPFLFILSGFIEDEDLRSDPTVPAVLFHLELSLNNFVLLEFDTFNEFKVLLQQFKKHKFPIVELYDMDLYSGFNYVPNFNFIAEKDEHDEQFTIISCFGSKYGINIKYSDFNNKIRFLSNIDDF